MLTAAKCGVSAPLSPLAQATIEKHLPGLSSKRLAIGATPQKRKQQVDVACCTGESFITFILLSTLYLR